jgi:SAM-dependent methyltransferase
VKLPSLIWAPLPPRAYDALQRFVHGDHSKEAEYVLEPYRYCWGQPVLEIGCGTGAWSRFFPGGTYTGLDNDPARIETARKSYPDAKFLVSDGSEISPRFLSNFRYVFCFNVIHHLSDGEVESLLEKLASAATEGTIIALCAEPLLDQAFRNPVGWLLAKLDRGRWVRTADHMKRLFGPYLRKSQLFPPRLPWPLPGGTFELAFPPVPRA